MFKASAAATEIGGGERGGETRRTLTEHALQVTIGRQHFHFLAARHLLLDGRRRGLPVIVHHAAVNLAHGGKVFLETLPEALAVQRDAVDVHRHLARQQLQTRRSIGQGVGLAVFFHLHAVFQVAQEGVSGGETRVFAVCEKALVAQTEEGDDGAAVAHPLLTAAVQALQTLHQELDVADAAGRQLHVEPAGRAALGCQFLADALAGFADGFNGAEIERALVNQRFDKLQQGGAGLALSGGEAGLDQHLLLPIARAVAVVSTRALFGDGDFA